MGSYLPFFPWNSVCISKAAVSCGPQKWCSSSCRKQPQPYTPRTLEAVSWSSKLSNCSLANRPFQVVFRAGIHGPVNVSAVILSPSSYHVVSCRRRDARARPVWLCIAALTAAFLPVGEPFTRTSGIWAHWEQPCKVNTSTYNFYFPKSLL